jgi:hypothetical protein
MISSEPLENVAGEDLSWFLEGWFQLQLAF